MEPPGLSIPERHVELPAGRLQEADDMGQRAQRLGVVSTMAAGNTAVLTYPDIGRLYNDKPVSSFRLVRDGFTESMPRNMKGLRAEAANDLWLNHWNIEMMIWVDTVGRSLAGGGSEFISKLNHNETSGRTDILASIKWLIKHGRVPARATLTQAEFGWEIASTGGRPANFKISKFWLHAQAR
jgi:hypothetical protein